MDTDVRLGRRRDSGRGIVGTWPNWATRTTRIFCGAGVVARIAALLQPILTNPDASSETLGGRSEGGGNREKVVLFSAELKIVGSNGSLNLKLSKVDHLNRTT